MVSALGPWARTPKTSVISRQQGWEETLPFSYLVSEPGFWPRCLKSLGIFWVTEAACVFRRPVLVGSGWGVGIRLQQDRAWDQWLGAFSPAFHRLQKGKQYDVELMTDHVCVISRVGELPGTPTPPPQTSQTHAFHTELWKFYETDPKWAADKPGKLRHSQARYLEEADKDSWNLCILCDFLGLYNYFNNKKGTETC